MRHSLPCSQAEGRRLQRSEGDRAQQVAEGQFTKKGYASKNKKKGSQNQKILTENPFSF